MSRLRSLSQGAKLSLYSASMWPGRRFLLRRAIRRVHEVQQQSRQRLHGGKHLIAS